LSKALDSLKASLSFQELVDSVLIYLSLAVRAFELFFRRMTEKGGMVKKNGLCYIKRIKKPPENLVLVDKHL